MTTAGTKADPTDWSVSQDRALDWLCAPLASLDPFDAAAREPVGPKESRPVPKEKIWTECAMALVMARLSGTQSESLDRAARQLAAPVKDPRFLYRLTRERGKFGAVIHTVALANAIGLDAAFEARMLLRFIDANAIWPRDQEVWEKLERAFSRAILGADTSYQSVLDTARDGVLWDDTLNLALVDETTAYKITHSVFYLTGMGLADLYQNAPDRQTDLPASLPDTLALLAARFFLLGSMDVALELVLSTILIDAPLAPIHLQILEAARVLVDSFGFVAPYVFEGAGRSRFSPHLATPEHAFEQGYHPTLVFVLVDAVAKLKGVSTGIDAGLERLRTRATGTAALLDGMDTARFTGASPALAAADVLVSLGRYDLHRAATVFQHLKHNRMAPSYPHFERDVVQFLDLQRMEEGEIGYYDVDLAADPDAIAPIVAETRDLINALLSSRSR